MKKKEKKLLTVILALMTLIPQTVLAQQNIFSDLYPTNQYYESINYLYEIGVINGYPDSTFKPDKTVSRVEFLKLALISSGIETDVYSPTGFPDINESAWYAPYVRKAKSEGWIEGYPDGTFKPSRGVNKAEALKMIAEIQEWEIETDIRQSYFTDVPASAWYAPYIEYAHDKNLLDERGSFFIAEAHLSRGKVSEYLYRAFLTNLSGADQFSPLLAGQYPASENIILAQPVLPEEQEVSFEFTPYDYKTIDKDFFENITLQEDFPNHFYLNEVYYFKGKIKSGDYSQTFIFLLPQDSDITEDHLTYVGKIEGSNLNIPVIFRHSGNYKLGLILGNAGESKIVNISVLESLPQNTQLQTNSPPSPLTVRYAAQNTTFSWDNNGNEIIKLIISQGSRNKEFIFRQGNQFFNVDYPDFKYFINGTTKYKLQGARLSGKLPLEISSNWAASEEKNFSAVEHISVKNRSGITVNNFPETLSKIQNISFSGTTQSILFDTAYIIKPDGNVDNVTLATSGTKSTYGGSETIPAGNDFQFSYTPQTAGTYIIEINKTDGSAVLNSPVYVATGIPLIPDYFDLNDNSNADAANFNLSAFRSELLNLINRERLNMRLNTVSINSELNNLAQMHSEDMAERDFFGHINPDGKSPDDRRIELGIETTVNENLATAGTVEYAHEGLMRSGVHRLNIIDPAWTRVGLGIAQKDNFLYITEEFTTNPLNQSDLNKMEQDTKAEINNYRNSLGLSTLLTNYSGDYAAGQWSQKMVDEDFFDFNSPNGETLEDLITGNLPDKTVQAIIFESNNIRKIIDEILLNSQIKDSYWQEIGLGIKNDNIGTLKVTLLLISH
jgi:uncharacterized protein YkwD